MAYCKERKSNGFVMIQDQLSPLYEAACVNLDCLDTDDLIGSCSRFSFRFKCFGGQSSLTWNLDLGKSKRHPADSVLWCASVCRESYNRYMLKII